MAKSLLRVVDIRKVAATVDIDVCRLLHGIVQTLAVIATVSVHRES